jgi:hypothetical protein
MLRHEVGIAGPMWRDKPRWYAKYAQKGPKIRENAEEEEEEEEESISCLLHFMSRLFWANEMKRQSHDSYE